MNEAEQTLFGLREAVCCKRERKEEDSEASTSCFLRGMCSAAAVLSARHVLLIAVLNGAAGVMSEQASSIQTLG